MENDKPRIGIWDHYEMTRCAGQCSSRSKEESTDFKEEREDGDVRARKNDHCRAGRSEGLQDGCVRSFRRWAVGMELAGWCSVHECLRHMEASSLCFSLDD